MATAIIWEQSSGVQFFLDPQKPFNILCLVTRQITDLNSLLSLHMNLSLVLSRETVTTLVVASLGDLVASPLIARNS